MLYFDEFTSLIKLLFQLMSLFKGSPVDCFFIIDLFYISWISVIVSLDLGVME